MLWRSTTRSASAGPDRFSRNSASCTARRGRWMRRALLPALAADREVGDRDAEAKVLNNLAILHAEQGRFDEARARFEESLAISRDLGDRRQTGLALAIRLPEPRTGAPRRGRGAAARCARDPPRHRRARRRRPCARQLRGGAPSVAPGRCACRVRRCALDRPRSRNPPRRRLPARSLGRIEHVQGRLDRARAAYDEALAMHRALGNRRYEGMVLASLGDLLAAQGRRDEARVLLADSELLLRGLGENSTSQPCYASAAISARCGRNGDGSRSVRRSRAMSPQTGAAPAVRRCATTSPRLAPGSIPQRDRARRTALDAADGERPSAAIRGSGPSTHFSSSAAGLRR